MVESFLRVISFFLLYTSELAVAVEEPHAVLSLDTDAPASSLPGPAPQVEWLAHLKARAVSFFDKCNGFVARTRDHSRQVERQPGQAPDPHLSQNAPRQIHPVVLIIEGIIQACILAVVGLLYAMYKSNLNKVVEVPEELDKDWLNDDFKYPLFSCLEAPCLSCFVCCCAGIRWADSARMLGKISFVVAVAIWAGIEFVGAITGGLLTWVGITIIGISVRQDIRKAFNMKSDNETFCYDCLSWCCCTCCTVIQEARQIEAAKVLGHDAVKDERQFDDFSVSELC